jgi:3'-phosphoadenosine 5'-phosphosulfate (PAPS) 3'-phosphatase
MVPIAIGRDTAAGQAICELAGFEVFQYDSEILVGFV